MNIFEKASRIGLIINSPLGKLTVTDLWSLPLTKLDSIAKSLNSQIKDAKEESFISSTKVDPILKLSFDIVKHIIDTKLTENKINNERKIRNAEIIKLQELISAKQDEELSKASKEELQEKLNSLLENEPKEEEAIDED